MGVVKKINELDMEISLPNQLVGYVSITEISPFITDLVERVAQSETEEELPVLSELYAVGQPLVCIVISIGTEDKENSKRLDLSINPEKVNESISGDLVKGMVFQF